MRFHFSIRWPFVQTAALLTLAATQSCTIATSSDQAQSNTGSQMLTIHAHSSLHSQNANGEATVQLHYKVDQDYQIILETKWTLDNEPQVKPIAVPVKRNFTASDVATGIALHLNMTCDTDQVVAQETQHPDYRDTRDDLLSTEDVLLPDFIQILSCTVRKQYQTPEDQPKNKQSHLKVFLSQAHSPQQTTTLNLSSAAAYPLALEITLEGSRAPTGQNLHRSKRLTFPTPTPPQQVLQGIANYLSTLGIQTTFPTPETLQIDSSTSDFHPHTIWFAPYDLNHHPEQDSSLTWSLSIP